MVRGNIKLNNPERFTGSFEIFNEKLEKTIKTATEKLGMVKPGQNQIVNIRVVMEDEGDILQQREDTGMFAVVSREFGKIISYLH